MPAIKTLTSSEINSISKEVFESLLDEIEETDDDDLDDDQKEAIIEKVKELYGGKIMKFLNKSSFNRAWKVSVFGVVPFRIFSANAEKHGPE